MIWDRYDDAMDDLRDDEIDLKAENRALEKKLNELGVKFDPLVQREEDIIRDHNDMYWNKSQDVISQEARNQYLKQLLVEAENGIDFFNHEGHEEHEDK
jgi:hypothetical protein